MCDGSAPGTLDILLASFVVVSLPGSFVRPWTIVPVALLRRWWGVLMGLMVLALPRVAAAAPVRADDRCVAAWAVSGLEVEERARLAELCASGGSPVLADLPLLVAMVTRASWEAAILGEFARGAAPHLDLGPDMAAAARLRELRQGLRRALVERAVLGSGYSPVCKDMRASLREYLEDRNAGETPMPPFAAHAIAADRCLALDPAAVAESHFVTVPADEATGLLVAAATAERIVLQWLAADDAFEVDGRRVFVVAVPRWSVVTVQASRKDAGAPATWHGFLTRDATIWDRQPEAGCLRLSVAVDPETTLLLDGRPVTRGVPLLRRTLGVVAGDHEFVAVRCDRQGQAASCGVRFREELVEEARTSTRNLCQDIEIDLKQSGTVAVLGATTAPGCDQAVGWQVGTLAGEYLRRSEAITGKQFSDLKAYASLTDRLTALKASLNPGAGQAVGARTGADSLDVLGTVAKEAWRQGIDELVTFELRCDADSGDYTLAGSVIGVRDVFTRERGLEGLDLQELLRVEAVRFRGSTTSGPLQLASAVASVLDRLFGREFIRFREGPASVTYRQRARLELLAHSRESHRRGALPEVSAYYIGDPRRPEPAVCKSLLHRGRDGALGGVSAMLGEPGRRRATSVLVAGNEDTSDSSLTATNVSASFRAPRPGTYLVVARWPGEREPVDATCVRFEVPDTELWASLMFAPDLSTRNGVREVQASHLRVHFGKTWYRPLPWLGLGMFGAYTFTNMVDREGLPAWQDIKADQSRSRERMQWFRHGALLGPLVEARSRRATLPIELRARLSAGFGVAITDVNRIPEVFAQLRTPEQLNANNLRVSPAIDVLLELGVGYHAGPLAISHTLIFGAIAVNDMVTASTAATARNGSSLVMGVGLILGGAP